MAGLTGLLIRRYKTVGLTFLGIYLIFYMLRTITPHEETFLTLNGKYIKDTYPRTKLVTLFTTFANRPDKFYIYKNVILNWSSFRSYIQPVLFGNFSSEDELANLALRHGWLIHPLFTANSTMPPFFKDLYRDAVKLTDSEFYGFCNGDMLFNEGLVKTLQAILKYDKTLASTLVVGCRTNVDVKQNSTENLFEYSLLTERARDAGKLDRPFAEDYFIMRHLDLFPWHTIKDELIIGRTAYDNYVIAQAIKGNVSVIDVTETVLAFHQTDADGRLASAHAKTYKDYNRQVIGPYNYTLGHIDYSQFVTDKDLSGQIYVGKRKHATNMEKP